MPPMPVRRFAYADPPYPGQARKHYGPDAREVDHVLLLAYLETFDGWALSTSSPALRDVLALCPPGVRIGAWVKPFASFKRGVDPAYAWEPVIYRTARTWSRDQPTCRLGHWQVNVESLLRELPPRRVRLVEPGRLVTIRQYLETLPKAS